MYGVKDHILPAHFCNLNQRKERVCTDNRNKT